MTSIAHKRTEAKEEAVSWAGEEERAFLALASIKGIGHKTLYAIADAGQSFANIFYIQETHHVVNLLRNFGSRIDGSLGSSWQVVREQASERAARLIEVFSEQNTVLIFRKHTAFPNAFHDLTNPPHWLFVRGNLDALARPALAVVGTREPSEDGQFLARYVGACLAYWGAATISGLAPGIDQLVHEYSLRFNVPTIAALGTGILSDYPRGAIDLKERIVAKGGAIITEYLPRETYSAQNFVMRNRLQAAFGRVLIPVEWNAKSGTAHTVRFAAGLQRPIAYLRMPDWDKARLPVATQNGTQTARVFTIPGDEVDFKQFVHCAISLQTQESRSDIGDPPQLSLFEKQ
jgi:DNA protecting protein DprA